MKLSNKFMLAWAKEAHELSVRFIGTMSGGIEPPKRMHEKRIVVHDNIVEIPYSYPPTCGLSDVIYHVIEPDKVRIDKFEFTDDGRIIMNGDPFPEDALKEPWLAADAIAFLTSYSTAFVEETGKEA